MIVEGIGQSIPREETKMNREGDNFDQVMKESEEELANIARHRPTRTVKDKMLQLDDVSLRSKNIEHDQTFIKLKQFLKKFTIRADDLIRNSKTYLIPEFSYQVRLHDCLRNMLREIVHTDDVKRQTTYLTRVYKWFFCKMNSIGAINSDEKQEEDEFMYPEKYAEKEKKRIEEINRKKEKLKDEEYNLEVEKARFEAGERTIHKDIIPAKERIEFYKRKLPKDPNQSMGETSTRPTTKSSTTRVKTAKTRVDTMYGQPYKPTYDTFYTSKGDVQYNNLLNVESKSSYLNYIPSDDLVEQKLEKMWKESKNREVAEKRWNEEIQQTLKDWGEAKSRYEEDIQRKTENQWFGSNFGARAFIRKTKPRKIDLRKNHLEDSDGSSLLSDSEIEASEKIEQTQLEEDDEDIKENKRTENTAAINAHANRIKNISQNQNAHRQRAQTAGRSQRKQFMPTLIDTSRDEGTKIWFPNIDPKGAKEEAERNDPKLKEKLEKAAKAAKAAKSAKAKKAPRGNKPVKPKIPEPVYDPNKDVGSVRPKTTDGGKRKINLLRRFHGDLISTSNNHMDFVDNVFFSGAQDVISLSVYNGTSSFKSGKMTQSAAVLPNARLRPQSAPFKFADGTPFNFPLRRDRREEIAEIESLKTRLTKDDIPFKVETIKKAYDMPEENEFKLEGRKYPYPDAYLIKNPFPKKKKKKKKGKKKSKK